MEPKTKKLGKTKTKNE